MTYGPTCVQYIYYAIELDASMPCAIELDETDLLGKYVEYTKRSDK